MRFTIEPEPLIKTVAMVGEWLPGRRKAEPTLRLVACAGRVYVESGGTVAEIEAAVSEDGQCGLSRRKLLAELQTHREEAQVTIHADGQGLLIGERWVPVQGYLSRTASPAAFQIFVATKAGVVSSPSTTTALEQFCLP